MSDLRGSTHAAACVAVRGGAPLDSLLTRGEQRRLVREARDWYLNVHAGNVTRQGTCVVATAGPPGAGKSSVLPAAVPDLGSRLVIDPDTVKDYLARWCTEHGAYYDDLLATVLPDGGTLRPLELSPLLQTMSTEVANAVRRDALAQRMDIVVEATMASPAYGERLLLSLAKADYRALLIVSVETDQQTAHARAVERWWTGRQAEPELGGRLVLPETIDAAYPGTRSASACRTNARNLTETIRAGGSAIEHVTIAEYDDGALARLDADPPRALDA
ncbi:zeta toxin family protein [Xylanimonas allomyrinae]|nr:zeta toxin family protein [Xylanimonas allomyrinae]